MTYCKLCNDVDYVYAVYSEHYILSYLKTVCTIIYKKSNLEDSNGYSLDNYANYHSDNLKQPNFNVRFHLFLYIDKLYKENKTRIVAVLYNRYNDDGTKFSSSNYIIDTRVIVLEPLPVNHIGSILGRRFGV